MTRVNSGDELAALMRVQIASLRRKTDISQPARLKTGAALATPQQGTGAADLASVAADRIRGIQQDDPQKNEKAMRIFLETVLLTELGSNLIGDPEFGRMVEHVQMQLQGSPELASATQEACVILLQAAHG